MPFTWTESTSVGDLATIDSYEEMYNNLEYVMVNLLNMGSPTHAIKPVKGAVIAPITFNLLRSDIDDAYDQSLITNCSSHNSSVDSSNNSVDDSAHDDTVQSSNNSSDNSTHNSGDDTSNNSGDDTSKYSGYETNDDSAFDSTHYWDNDSSEYKTVYSIHNTLYDGPDA